MLLVKREWRQPSSDSFTSCKTEPLWWTLARFTSWSPSFIRLIERSVKSGWQWHVARTDELNRLLLQLCHLHVSTEIQAERRHVATGSGSGFHTWMLLFFYGGLLIPKSAYFSVGSVDCYWCSRTRSFFPGGLSISQATYFGLISVDC